MTLRLYYRNVYMGREKGALWSSPNEARVMRSCHDVAIGVEAVAHSHRGIVVVAFTPDDDDEETTS